MADILPTSKSVVLLLELVAELRARLDELETWQGQVEAVWPQITEGDDNEPN